MKQNKEKENIIAVTEICALGMGVIVAIVGIKDHLIPALFGG